MEEVIEEHYTYKDILVLIKSIYGLAQAAHCWFKEYINTMTLNTGFKQLNTDTCILYRVNELGTVIVFVYVDGTLAIKR